MEGGGRNGRLGVDLFLRSLLWVVDCVLIRVFLYILYVIHLIFLLPAWVSLSFLGGGGEFLSCGLYQG